MPDVVVGHIEDPESLKAVFTEFERHHPGIKIGMGHFEGDDGEVATEYGGVRYIWIDRGAGEVFLDSGYRTQEGDGERLPAIYETDRCDDENWSILQTLAGNLDTLHERIRPPVEGILDRVTERTLVGDIANEIWLMEESGASRGQWSSRPKVRRTFELLLVNYSTIGWSTKQTSSFEPIQAGDQLTVLDDEPIRVRGKFSYWWIENTNIFMTHLTTARRLRYLRDTAGGCNTSTDGFRRLTMTWHCNTATADEADGINTVNSHVVNITAQSSRTHYHPAIPVGGGKPQHEIYLALNPSAYSLNTYGRDSHLHVFPDLTNLANHEQIPLTPGDVVYIPPDTGHRAVDAFVNVVTLPGFKPHNEVDLDAQIKETTNGSVPYNENVLH